MIVEGERGCKNGDTGGDEHAPASVTYELEFLEHAGVPEACQATLLRKNTVLPFDGPPDLLLKKIPRAESGVVLSGRPGKEPAAIISECTSSLVIAVGSSYCLKLRPVTVQDIPPCVSTPNAICEALCYEHITRMNATMGVFPVLLGFHVSGIGAFEERVERLLGTTFRMNERSHATLVCAPRLGASIYEWFVINSDDMRVYNSISERERLELPVVVRRCTGALMLMFGNPDERRLVNRIVRGLVFQVILGVYQAHRAFMFCHNDLHTKNCAWKARPHNATPVRDELWESGANIVAGGVSYRIPPHWCPSVGVFDFEYASFVTFDGYAVNGYYDQYQCGNDGAYDVYRFVSSLVYYSVLSHPQAWEGLDADLRGFISKVLNMEPILEGGTRVFPKAEQCEQFAPCMANKMSLFDALHHEVFDVFRSGGSVSGGYHEWVEEIGLESDKAWAWKQFRRVFFTQLMSVPGAPPRSHGVLVHDLTKAPQDPLSWRILVESVFPMMIEATKTMAIQRQTINRPAHIVDHAQYDFYILWKETQHTQLAIVLLSRMISKAHELGLEWVQDPASLHACAQVAQATVRRRWVGVGWDGVTQRSDNTTLNTAWSESTIGDVLGIINRLDGEILGMIQKHHDHASITPVHSIDVHLDSLCPEHTESRAQAKMALVNSLESSIAILFDEENN